MRIERILLNKGLLFLMYLNGWLLRYVELWYKGWCIHAELGVGLGFHWRKDTLILLLLGLATLLGLEVGGGLDDARRLLGWSVDLFESHLAVFLLNLLHSRLHVGTHFGIIFHFFIQVLLGWLHAYARLVG